MKSSLILLAVLGLFVGIDAQAGSVLEKAIEDLRDQMPCGFPNSGIPPLDPLRIAYQAVDVDTESMKMQGNVDHFVLNGLSNFEIAEMRQNILTSRVTFSFVFKDINLDTSYNLWAMLKQYGFTVNMIGDGPAKISLKNVVISGNIRYNLGLLSGSLRLRSITITTANIGEIDSDIKGVLGNGNINEMMNEFLASAVQTYVNDNESAITNMLDSRALPIVNEKLSDVNIYDMGGSGGEGEGGAEKEACIPPEWEW